MNLELQSVDSKIVNGKVSSQNVSFSAFGTNGESINTTIVLTGTNEELKALSIEEAEQKALARFLELANEAAVRTDEKADTK